MMKEIELSRAVTEEAARCLLCYDAPCAAACPLGRAPDHLVRSLVLGNPLGAIQQELSGACPADCARHCMKACLRAKIDLPIRLSFLRKSLREAVQGTSIAAMTAKEAAS